MKIYSKRLSGVCDIYSKINLAEERSRFFFGSHHLGRKLDDNIYLSRCASMCESMCDFCLRNERTGSIRASHNRHYVVNPEIKGF